MPYNKRFQKQKRELQNELEERVEKGDITLGQSHEIVAAWQRDNVRFNECGERPDTVIKISYRKRKIG